MKNTKLEICNKCWGTGHVHGGDENSTWSKSCEDCRGLGFVRVPKTNADRIRDMSDEELADWISNFVYEIGSGEVAYSDDTDQWLFWLQQPCKGE